MPSAIVTGATGILGREIVHALGQQPDKWTSVHALSRSQKEDYPKNVKHDTIDLTSDAKDMAKQLEGVTGEYVFFAAYLQKDSEQENWDVNGDMLRNFFDALVHTGAIKAVKRFILVTGCKYYGVHLGRVKVPMTEDDPRIDGPDRPPNFYYRQQDLLAEYAQKHGFEWVVTYPNDVIGVAVNNFMNLATPLALYALVSRELNPDRQLPWPGSERYYHLGTAFTESRLHASFCLWAAAEPRAANQAFNVVNGEGECWENLWPQLAARFGATVPPDQFAKPAVQSKSSSVQLADRPPLADFADRTGLQGSEALECSRIEARIDVVKWAARDDVKAAWKRVAEREGLDPTAFGKAPWWFLRFELGRNFSLLISMSKARRFGWTGYVDTWDAFESAFKGLEEIKVLPKGSGER